MKTTVEQEIKQIKESLSLIEGHMMWVIKAEYRFAPGQRVEWSRNARSQGFPTRKVAQKATVLAVDGFSVYVKLDGMKKSKSFHHAFFNPVNGQKLF